MKPLEHATVTELEPAAEQQELEIETVMPAGDVPVPTPRDPEMSDVDDSPCDEKAIPPVSYVFIARATPAACNV